MHIAVVLADLHIIEDCTLGLGQGLCSPRAHLVQLEFNCIFNRNKFCLNSPTHPTWKQTMELLSIFISHWKMWMFTYETEVVVNTHSIHLLYFWASFGVKPFSSTSLRSADTLHPFKLNITM